MALEPEEMALPGLMQGLKVVVEYIRGPQLTEENVDRVLDEGEVLSGQPEARTAVLYLEAFSSYGIEVSQESGDRPTTLIPWAAVLAMYRLSENREDLIRLAKEDVAARQDQQMEEGNPT